MKLIFAFTNNHVILHEGRVHKCLANEDCPFLKCINLVPNSLRPHLWLLDLIVYVDCMLIFLVSSSTRVFVVASMNSLIVLLFTVGILNLKLAGLKFKMLLNEIMESCSDVTVVKLARSLNRDIPSSFSGKLPDCVKIVALRSQVTRYSIYLKRVLLFWMAMSSVRLVHDILMPVSVME